MTHEIKFKSIFLSETLEEGVKYILDIIKGGPCNGMIRKLRNSTSNQSIARDAISKYPIEIGLASFVNNRSDSIFKYFTQDDFEKTRLFCKEFCDNFQILFESIDKNDTLLLNYVRGKLIDGVSSNDGLSAFSFEISLSAFMQLRGFSTNFPEYEKKSKGETEGGVCDILVASEEISLAIDAKCIHADTGMMIPNKIFEEISRDFLLSLPEERRSLFINTVIVFDRIEHFDNIPGDVADLIIKASREIEPDGTPLESRYLRISAFRDEPLFRDNINSEIDLIVNNAIPRAVETRHDRKVETILAHKSLWGKIPVVVSLARKVNHGLLNNSNIYKSLKSSFARQLKQYESSIFAIHVPDIIDDQEGFLFDGSVEEDREPQIVMLASRLFKSDSFTGLSGVILFGKKFFVKKEDDKDQKTFYGMRKIVVILNRNHTKVNSFELAFEKAGIECLII